jgi:TIR domain
MAEYYEFFFSFASADWKQGKRDDLWLFFEHLQEKLKTFGFKGAGFWAPDDIGRGRDWEDELNKALPASHVLVPIYSPNYFKSIWCGKEWEVFWRRQHENENAPPPDVQAPNVILPAIWTAEFLDLPTRVRKIQYKAAVDPPAYADKGLGYMIQSPKRFSTQYGDFVHRFATELARMIQNQGAAKMRTIPNLDELDLPFPAHYKRGLSHVRYVFLAGRRDEMQDVREQIDCYGSFESRQDWRPCFPDDRLVGDLARGVAAETSKAYEFVDVFEPEKVVKMVREASARKNIIAVVVDPWEPAPIPVQEIRRKI